MPTPTNDQSDEARGRWLLLFHQIPPKPAYLRVKIGRSLQGIGAVPIKNAVYALPRSEDALESFQWVAREIVDGRGEAHVVEARFVEGFGDAQIEQLFRTARGADYAALLKEAQRLGAPRGSKGLTGTEVARLRKWLDEIVKLDFFAASGRQTAQALVARLEKRMEPSTDPRKNAGNKTAITEGRTWVTRTGVKIDRIASAWLIQSFIDRRSSFKFVPSQGYKPLPGELRFDMFEAEYTREGDRCSFEVLLQRFGLDDPALRQVAEVVHDIDLKDGTYGRPETAGIERLIEGLVASNPDDEQRLALGATLFASLFQSFRSSPA